MCPAIHHLYPHPHDKPHFSPGPHGHTATVSAASLLTPDGITYDLHVFEQIEALLSRAPLEASDRQALKIL